METKDVIKRLAIKKYGSMRKFAQSIDVPPSTVASILRSDDALLTASFENTARICRALDIKLDGLDGRSYVIDYDLTDNERKIIKVYREDERMQIAFNRLAGIQNDPAQE